jgi:hypothetical protein
MPALPTDIISFQMPGTVARAGGRGGGGGGGRGGVVAAGGGTGGARLTGGGRGAGSSISQITPLLEGHQFGLTMRISQIK